MLISISQFLCLLGDFSDLSGTTRFTNFWRSRLAWRCTTGFYSGFSDGYSSPAYSVDSSSFLSGRFSSEGIRFRNSFSSYVPVYQTSSGPRLPYFLGKVSDTSFPRFPVFGGTLQDRFRSDFSPRGKISVTLPENSYFQQQSFSHGSTILSTTGLSEFSSRCGSSRSPSHSTSPVLSSGTLGLCFSSLGGSSTYSSCRTTSPRLVDSQGKCFDRCSFASPSSFSNSVYRFQSSRMGSLSRGKVCVGSVVSCSATRTHQFVSPFCVDWIVEARQTICQYIEGPWNMPDYQMNV
jgi:hypothetical protein